MSSVLEALKKVETEKTKRTTSFSKPFESSVKKRMSISHDKIKHTVFILLLISFLGSIFYIYDFKKKKDASFETTKRILFDSAKEEQGLETAMKSIPKQIEISEEKPFIPAEQPKQQPEPQPKKKTPPEPVIRLEMISWTYKPEDRIAIINKKAVKEKEFLNGIRIVQIRPKYVVVNYNGKNRVIKYIKKGDGTF